MASGQKHTQQPSVERIESPNLKISVQTANAAQCPWMDSLSRDRPEGLGGGWWSVWVQSAIGAHEKPDARPLVARREWLRSECRKTLLRRSGGDGNSASQTPQVHPTWRCLLAFVLALAVLRTRSAVSRAKTSRLGNERRARACRRTLKIGEPTGCAASIHHASLKSL